MSASSSLRLRGGHSLIAAIRLLQAQERKDGNRDSRLESHQLRSKRRATRRQKKMRPRHLRTCARPSRKLTPRLHNARPNQAHLLLHAQRRQDSGRRHLSETGSLVSTPDLLSQATSLQLRTRTTTTGRVLSGLSQTHQLSPEGLAQLQCLIH